MISITASNWEGSLLNPSRTTTYCTAVFLKLWGVPLKERHDAVLYGMLDPGGTGMLLYCLYITILVIASEWSAK